MVSNNASFRTHTRTHIFKGSVGSKTSYFSKAINLAPSEIVDSVAYVSSSSKNMSMTDLY